MNPPAVLRALPSVEKLLQALGPLGDLPRPVAVAFTRRELAAGYSAKVRDVPQDVKRQAYANYGIRTHAKGEYEVDHLIPLSIGGSNSLKNLWPESYLTDPWNAHVKDALEYRLLSLVRAGKVDLKTAQQEIARDWIAAYKKYVGPEPGRSKAGATGATVPGLRTPRGLERPSESHVGLRLIPPP